MLSQTRQKSLSLEKFLKFGERSDVVPSSEFVHLECGISVYVISRRPDLPAHAVKKSRPPSLISEPLPLGFPVGQMPVVHGFYGLRPVFEDAGVCRPEAFRLLHLAARRRP